MDCKISTLFVFLTSSFLNNPPKLKGIYVRTPDAFKNRIISGETVHPLSSMEQLHKRITGNRRIYVLVDEQLPQEPLVFVSIAVLPQLAASMKVFFSNSQQLFQMVFDPTVHPLEKCKTVTFYSINSPIKGLKNVELGPLLIKRVYSTIEKELGSKSKFFFAQIS
jgi:malonyl-CoA decarboxylase